MVAFAYRHARLLTLIGLALLALALHLGWPQRASMLDWRHGAGVLLLFVVMVTSVCAAMWVSVAVGRPGWLLRSLSRFSWPLLLVWIVVDLDRLVAEREVPQAVDVVNLQRSMCSVGGAGRATGGRSVPVHTDGYWCFWPEVDDVDRWRGSLPMVELYPDVQRISVPVGDTLMVNRLFHDSWVWGRQAYYEVVAHPLSTVSRE